MTAKEALPILLKSYVRYYNIKEEEPTPPFAAEAEFHSQDVQYFLFKSVRMNEWDSHEYVFFAVSQHLTLEEARKLDEAAWQTGMERTEVGEHHRSSDVHLIILADTVDDDAAQFLKKLRRYQSYRHGLRGWSHFRVVALEVSSGRLVFNRMGQILKKLFGNIKIAIKESNEK